MENKYFYFVTTTNIAPDAGFTEYAGGGDGTGTNVYYSSGYSGPKNVAAIYNVADTANLTNITDFLNRNGSLYNVRDLLTNTTGVPTNDFKFTSVGTGLAYYLKIPKSQGGGNYSATITLDLTTAT